MTTPTESPEDISTTAPVMVKLKNGTEEMALLQSNHQPHDSIKNIVLSAVVGDGLDMRLINPVAA